MKVQYYSEALKRTFNTEEECLKAEQELKEKLAAESKLKEQRSERAKEVQAAYQKYLNLRAEFIKDYGQYHMTLTDKDLPKFGSGYSMFDLLEEVFK